MQSRTSAGFLCMQRTLGNLLPGLEFCLLMTCRKLSYSEFRLTGTDRSALTNASLRVWCSHSSYASRCVTRSFIEATIASISLSFARLRDFRRVLLCGGSSAARSVGRHVRAPNGCALATSASGSCAVDSSEEDVTEDSVSSSEDESGHPNVDGRMGRAARRRLVVNTT